MVQLNQRLRIIGTNIVGKVVNFTSTTVTIQTDIGYEYT